MSFPMFSFTSKEMKTLEKSPKTPFGQHLLTYVLKELGEFKLCSKELMSCNLILMRSEYVFLLL